ncbi:MAG: chemotaxis protein CheV [Desulfovibrio sp.]|nr:chemotaxis protein CheV [Desulfovibrio sp.]
MSLNPLLRNNELEIIEFLLDEKLPDGKDYTGHYAINVAKVLEIIRMPQVTAMPGTQDPSIMGTFNLRGKVLPLLNLAAWLGKDMRRGPSDKVLVTEFSGVRTAFLVSSVASIHRLAWDRIEPPNRYVQAFSRDSITGILRIKERVLFILDMEKIMASLDKSLDMSTMQPEAPVEMPEHVRLLLADDSSSLRKIVKSFLEKSGYQVTTASNGREAWEYLSNLAQSQSGQKVDSHEINQLVDLVISDIEMPEMDGHALTSKIRENPALKKLPVVLFSSLITDALRAKGIKVGADHQVNKPDLAGLDKIVKEIIDEKIHSRHQ